MKNLEHFEPFMLHKNVAPRAREVPTQLGGWMGGTWRKLKHVTVVVSVHQRK